MHLKTSILKGVTEEVWSKRKTLAGQKKVNSYFEDPEFSPYREMQITSLKMLLNITSSACALQVLGRERGKRKLFM